MISSAREELLSVAEKVLGVVKATSVGFPPLQGIQMLLTKGSMTYRGIQLLYANELHLSAQALVRILLEARIDLEFYYNLLREDPSQALGRLVDSMALEKHKQFRASGYRTDDDKSSAALKKELETLEAEISSRYSADDLKRLKANGFTFLPVEQRAREIGLDPDYQVLYRNLSRNVHNGDYAELFNLQSKNDTPDYEEYLRVRDHLMTSSSDKFFWVMVAIADAVSGRNFMEKMQKIRPILKIS